MVKTNNKNDNKTYSRFALHEQNTGPDITGETQWSCGRPQMSPANFY